MTSNIQFVSEFAGSIPVASAPGRVRLFRDSADGLLKFKDNTGAIFPIAGTQDYKDAVRCASAAVLPAYTRVGNQITANANGALAAIDGVTLIANDSFLYVNGSGIQERDNGIWVVTQVGSGALPFILDRRGDFAASSQVSPGCVIPTGPEGGSNGKKLFILTTPDPIVINSSGLTFEAISGGGGFTATEIDTTVSVPDQQSMLFSDDVVIEDDGDLSLDGDVTPVREEENFSVNFIPQRSVRVVQENDQMLFTDSMQIDGDLIVDGDILDATPYDGNDILNALTAIAPNTPSILGVASPASFLSPAQARTVMSVPSIAQMEAAIAAGSTGLTFEPGVQTAAFDALPGKIYVWDCNETFDANLPAAPPANAIIGFYGDPTNGDAGELEIEAGTNDVIFPGGGDEFEISGKSLYAINVLQFRETTGPGVGYWALVNSDLVLNSLTNAGPNSIGITQTTGGFNAVQIDDESVVGRTGGGDITSIPISSLGGGGNLPFSAANWAAGGFTANLNEITRFTGDFTGSAIIPDTGLADGDIVALYATAATTGNTLTVDFGTKTILGLASTFPLVPQVISFSSAPAIVAFKWSQFQDYWVIFNAQDQLLLTTGANRIGISNADSQQTSITIGTDSLVGRAAGTITGLSAAQALTILFPNQSFVDASVNTTDATPTTITGYTPGANFSVITFDLTIQAQSNNNNDVAVFKMVGVCNRQGGSNQIFAKDLTFTNGPYRDAGAAAWTVSFDIPGNGPTINVVVTGDGGEDIDWRVTGSISEHS